MEDRRFYVYKWYFISTGEIFHIGKGTGLRYLDNKHSRNKYFKSIVEKYCDDVKSDIIISNLTEQESWDKERELIAYYKSIGECKTNFHVGGRGGFTGNTPERSKKLSIAASKRTGSKNAMYGKTHTPEAIEKIKKANLGKHLSEEHKQKLIQANTGRAKTPEEIEKLRKANLGKTLSETHYLKMMKADCDYMYKVYVNNINVYWCLGHSLLDKYCENTFNISRSIIRKITNNTWVPKFNKHKWLNSIKIEKISKSVSTNWDECTSVEWRLVPFEVHDNQFLFG